MEKEKRTFSYRLVKGYFRYIINGLYYRKFYSIDADHIPEEGNPVLIVSNHQFCLNDALGVLLAVNDRKMHFIARANAFDIHPLFAKFMLWAGVLPAFRMMHEGEEALDNNKGTFQLTEQNLLDGRSILLYPEAGHQTRRWLGTFAYGYTRMAFEAAEKSNFEQEIFILPSCNHYSHYFGMRNDLLIRFGTPISIKPWYETYKTKPRTAWREVNRLVREQIRSMMLDIQDLENYDEIDFLRQSQFGKDFARALGKDPDVLPEKLEADRELVARLAEKQVTYEDVRELREAMEAHGLTDREFRHRPWPIGKLLLLTLLLPLAIVGVWPALPTWFISEHFSNKMEDRMFQGSFLLAIFCLVMLPLSTLITLAAEWPLIGAWALLHTALLPILCVFEWNWFQLLQKALRELRYRRHGAAIRPLRERVFKRIKDLVI